MNLGIHQTARASKVSNANTTSGIPAFDSLSKLASQMGVDFTELGDQAEQMWTTLNDLHDTDPTAYQEFIRNQVETNKEFIQNKNRNSNTRKIFPNPGFMVKSAYVVGFEDVFVNICHHEAMQYPSDPNGAHISSYTEMDSRNLHIPLVVSPIRSRTISDKSKTAIIDVIVHKWCIQKAKSSNVFREELIALATKSAMEDYNLDVANNMTWEKLDQPKYKKLQHGDETDKHDVYPFEIDFGKNENKIEQKCTTDIRFSVKNKSLDGPPALLQEGKNGDQFKITLPIEGTPQLNESSSKKPLIQEINRLTSNKGNKSNLTKDMKGFLLGSKAKRQSLYDEKGSSGDGLNGTGGSYVKLLSKCHVVDSTKSSSSQVSTQNKRGGDQSCIFEKEIHRKVENNGNDTSVQKKQNMGDGTFGTEFDRLISNMNLEKNASHAAISSKENLVFENLQGLPEHNSALKTEKDKCISEKGDEENRARRDNELVRRNESYEHHDKKYEINEEWKSDEEFYLTVTYLNDFDSKDLLTEADLQICSTQFILTRKSGKQIIHKFKRSIDASKVTATCKRNSLKIYYT